MKPFPQRICIKGANIANAVIELRAFKQSQDLKEISRDVVCFLTSLCWEQIQKDIASSFYCWLGNDWAERILQRWDWDDDILKKATVALNSTIGEINLSAKYYFAWQIIQSFLATKSKLSYELIWESGEDLACSFLLAKEGYYKQAFQALRNYLEVSVSILYFAVDKNAYINWIENNNFYHFPKFHKDEKYHRDMLSRLGEYLDRVDIEFMSSQYEKLNASVHSRRHRINMNIGRLQRSRNDFGARDLKHWSNTFNKNVRFMTSLFFKTLFLSSSE